MDTELVSQSVSEEAKKRAVELTAKFRYPYTHVFEEKFPYYISIGMTYDQYWNDDPGLTVLYRKADKLRLNRINEQAWLQGMYIYDAISRLAPVLRPFAKKGTKAQPYPSEPYSLETDEHSEEKAKTEKENAEKKQMLRNKDYMRAYMSKFNRKFKEGK